MLAKSKLSRRDNTFVILAVVMCWCAVGTRLASRSVCRVPTVR